MPTLKCNHESEGFCRFKGTCPYQFMVVHTNDVLCEEFCQQWIKEWRDDNTQQDSKAPDGEGCQH
jgi:hypothetical protein